MPPLSASFLPPLLMELANGYSSQVRILCTISKTSKASDLLSFLAFDSSDSYIEQPLQLINEGGFCD